MKATAVQSLGFGFPGFYSQARGSGASMGAPWTSFRPMETRAEENLPPQVKARLGRLRGLGQGDFITLTADDYYPYDQEFPDSYPQVSSTPMPSSQNWWQTSIQTPITTQSTAATPSTGGINWDAAIANVQKLLQAGMTYDAQRRILDLNLARAQQGLAPIDASRLSPGLNFGLTPDTRNMLMIGGVALLAVLLVGRKKK